MGDTTSMNLRIDKELKKQAETLFAGLGLNMTTAINIFLKQAASAACFFVFMVFCSLFSASMFRFYSIIIRFNIPILFLF